MPYNSRSGSVNLGANEDLVPEMAPHFVHMLRDLAADPSSPTQIKQDWAILQEWLGCDENGLTAEHDQKVTTAWKGYLGRGLAPSLRLQSTFLEFRAKLQSTGQPLAPPLQHVVEVFDRFLATDDEIRTQREFTRKSMARSGNDNDAPRARSPVRSNLLSARLFGSHEGVRRLSVAAATVWVLSWLAYAGMLQAELWDTFCPYRCSDEVTAIWRAIAFAALGPAAIAVIVHVIRWIQAGFRAQ